MTDGKALSEVIENSGITITFIAAKLGCSRNRIYSILNGSECTASEIVALCEVLHMDRDTRDKIFLSQKVIDNHAQAEPIVAEG